MSRVAFIPARSGSQRVPDKNVRTLAGHPLLGYAIAAALASEVFDAVVVSTDSASYARIAEHYGAEVPTLRPAELSGSRSPDIDWVRHMLATLAERGRSYEFFSILRPTSPFRRSETIRRAWHELRAEPDADSLRAVERCRQHPGKMWTVEGRRMSPLMPFRVGDQPWHSNQYAALPEVYVQNASLEIARSRVIEDYGNIAGHAIVPFFTRDHEGFDINDPLDWALAEQLVREAKAVLPEVGRPAYVG